MISAYSIPGVVGEHPVNDDLMCDFIINAVCQYYQKDREFIVKQTREREVVKLRYMCFALMKKKTSLTLKSIGKQLDRKYDHTTVIHGLKAIKDLCDVYQDVRNEVAEIESIVIKKQMELFN